jgi:cation diffusion facilitator CzcD-associated flavoprotein CzcO
METGYYEAYNRDNVHLVDLQETPIQRITREGVRTSVRDYEFDIIIYATGFDAVTGAYDRIDIRGVGGQNLSEKWANGPITYLGMQVAGFPNLIMPTGPQSGSASTNFPRGIELAVEWATDLLRYMSKNNFSREEATPQAEAEWGAHVAALYDMVLTRKAQSWFTGYNSNVQGHEQGNIRYVVYNGGLPKFRAKITEVADSGYAGITFR